MGQSPRCHLTHVYRLLGTSIHSDGPRSPQRPFTFFTQPPRCTNSVQQLLIKTMPPEPKVPQEGGGLNIHIDLT